MISGLLGLTQDTHTTYMPDVEVWARWFMVTRCAISRQLAGCSRAHDITFNLQSSVIHMGLYQKGRDGAHCCAFRCACTSALTLSGAWSGCFTSATSRRIPPALLVSLSYLSGLPLRLVDFADGSRLRLHVKAKCNHCGVVSHVSAPVLSRDGSLRQLVSVALNGYAQEDGQSSTT